MTKLAAKLQTKLAVQKDKGATAVEYGLMVALIAAAIVATVGALGEQLNTLFTEITTELAGVAP